MDCRLILVLMMGWVNGIKDSRLLAAPPVRITSFNIQIFGINKMKREIVVDTLLKILPEYDIITIQEIRDASESAFPKLVQMINEKVGDGKYDWVVSKRLGRSTSKEQYGFLYRCDRVDLLATYQFVDGRNNGTDVFEREPFSALFRVKNAVVEEFSIISVHTKPDDAASEIDALTEVYDRVAHVFENPNSIIAGDFNADCNFVRSDDWANISLWTEDRFDWAINRCQDTTVKRTDCSYDRFVVAGEKLQAAVVPKSPKVVRFDVDYGLTYDQTVLVSDHYPIEMELMGKAIRGVQTRLDTYLAFTIAESGTATLTALNAVLAQAPRGGKFDIMATNTVGGEPYEIIAKADRVRDLTSYLDDFRNMFPSVLSIELDRAFRSFVQSEAFTTVPYVYGLKINVRKTYELEIRCEFSTLKCRVSAYRRTS